MQQKKDTAEKSEERRHCNRKRCFANQQRNTRI